MLVQTLESLKQMPLNNYQKILEYINSKSSRKELEESFLENALFIEDTFGIYLTDEEITPTKLGSADAIIALMDAKTTCAESAE